MMIERAVVKVARSGRGSGDGSVDGDGEFGTFYA